jgi:hypothetical protein
MIKLVLPLHCNCSTKFFQYIHFKWVDINCSKDGSIEEYATSLLKVAWMVFPIGLFFTFAGCALVFWLKGLSFSDPYAQAIGYPNKW